MPLNLVLMVKNAARRSGGRMLLLIMLLSLTIIGAVLVSAATYNVMTMQSSAGVKPFSDLCYF